MGTLNHSGIEAKTFFENRDDTMPADALNPGDTRSSATRTLIQYKDDILPV